MFPVEATQLLQAVLPKVEWTLLSCASFEDRWLGLPAILKRENLHPSEARFLFPIDGGSRWERECIEKQESLWRDFDANYDSWMAGRIAFNMQTDSSADSALQLGRDLETRTVVLDISAMPKACMLPLFKSLYQDTSVQTLICTYTEAAQYGQRSLQAEPTIPSIARGYDALPSIIAAADIGWIPVLGFVPLFVSLIHESLADDYQLANRVFPLLAMPALEPEYFERALLDTGRPLLETLKRTPEVRDHFMYAPGNDPFATRDVLIRILKATPGVSWICSPMGPKPMTLGAALAAEDEPLTLMTVPARSYHPDLSSGIGRTHAFQIRRDGKRAF